MAVFLAKRMHPNSGGASRFRALLWFSRLLELIVAWNRCSRDWHLLAGLDERNLRDIGIDSGMFGRDGTMSFWRLRHDLELGVDRRSVERRRNEYPLP